MSIFVPCRLLQGMTGHRKEFRAGHKSTFTSFAKTPKANTRKSAAASTEVPPTNSPFRKPCLPGAAATASCATPSSSPKRARSHVTSATKSNGIIYTMPFWDERFAAIAKEYPGH